MKREEVIVMEGYCVKCRAKQEMKDPRKEQMKNGKWCYKGSCPTCGTTMVKICKADA